MAANKIEIDLSRDLEDPAISWLDLVMATRDEDAERGAAKIRELIAAARRSNWTYAIWDDMIAELETPEVEWLDPWDSDDEAAVATLDSIPEQPMEESWFKDEGNDIVPNLDRTPRRTLTRSNATFGGNRMFE